MVKVLERLGQNDRLGLSGRPVRPIGALGSSKVNLISIEIISKKRLKFPENVDLTP
jgi:hypothetical protein